MQLEKKMRRSDKLISDKKEIEEIIKQSTICRLAMCSAGQPYIVPFSFGYRDNVLYFHSAKEGEKIDILRRNNRVCFEFDLDAEVVKAAAVCSWGVTYRSVIGTGRAFFIEDSAEKQEALQIIVNQYGDDGSNMPAASVNNTLVFAVNIEEITGKQSPPPKE